MKYYSFINQTWKIKILFIFLVCLFFISGWFYFLILPAWHEKNKYESLINVDKINSHSHLPIKFLQKNLSANELMSICVKIATRQRLVLLIVRPSHRKISKLEVENLFIKAKGDFSQIIHFYQQLLSLPYFIRLPRWQIIATSNDLLQLTVFIEVYHKN